MLKGGAPTRKVRHGRAARGDNRLRPADEPAHRWYRFVLSFPPHLVREYVERFGLDTRHHVLDPFCGTGTTLVECKKLGIPCVGVEANPMACFASQVKVDWEVDPDGLLQHAREVARAAADLMDAEGLPETYSAGLFRSADRPSPRLRTLSPEQSKLLLRGSISPIPLHRTLVLLQMLERFGDSRFISHERLALANALVSSISNLHFGPEVGVGSAKSDAPVCTAWLEEVRAMTDDLAERQGKQQSAVMVHQADARNLSCFLRPKSVDAVITSPPYPNEKDYTRTTRLESVLLGFVRGKEDLRTLKQNLVRSNTRGVFKGDADDAFVAERPEIERIACAIERRREELRKTSGFERLYARVTRLYFGGMARHLADLRGVLRPGAQLAYVVGDQASYLRIMIRTGRLLADIAESLGYEVRGIDLFRTRLATATREQLREEVVLLRWSGGERGGVR